ncbi:MAG: glycine--tRNA ligase subunit beta [Alphaproteobacteria bacterium]
MAELLIEVLTEEIPARMQARAAQDFKRLLTERLAGAGLAFDTARAFVTPRRLAVVIDGLPERQPDTTEERKGPKVGAPDKAVEGFLRAAGVSGLDQCEQREVGNALVWFVVRKREGLPTREVLPDLIAGAIRDIPWPKSMRWVADSAARFVRPLHGIVALFDRAVLTGGYDVGGAAGIIPFGDTTRGHRFLAPEPFAVRDFADYGVRLREAYVLLDPAERRAIILAEARRLAADEGLVLREDEGLLDEVTGLVEWPVPYVGSIDEVFMTVPPEVLVGSMRAHQKYFSLETHDGTLAPRFVVVANTETRDGGRQVIAGNERVLRARLSDARFFWDQDRRVALADRLPALDRIVFHAKLGSVGDKVRRLRSLAATLARHIPGTDAPSVEAAATLCKADLVTGMVGEFPELQGLMGRYYALEEGQPAPVAEAIARHYAPQGPGDACPTDPVAVAVALADKIDTLTGFFALGEKPTGSRDPYALRRAGLGIIRLIRENGLRLPLRRIFADAHGAYASQGYASQGMAPPDRTADIVATELLDFLADRLKVHLREEGVRHDLITAVFALGDEDDLVRLLARVEALSALLASEDGANLLIAYRRASNIVAIEEKRDGVRQFGAPDRDRLQAEEEVVLAAGLAAERDGIAADVRADRFADAMRRMAALRPLIDAFFDKVTVNVPESGLRENRLRLLAQIRDTMHVVADFSKIEG